ncbi:MAG: pilus assembly protein TadG-related protein [Candidatus Omnitrophota bacterium]
MKKLKFNTILNYFQNKKGQIFPFLFLILVILIIATMVYVNVSQVDTHKIDTMNAADAAALAAAASLAQTANSIADINVNLLMKTFWTRFWWGTFRPGYTGVPTYRLYEWWGFAVSQLTTYLDSCLSAYKAVQSSAAIAHTTALGNLNIEEAEKREGNITGTRAVSDFSRWLDNQKFYDNRNANPTTLTYNWWSYKYDFDHNNQTQPDYGNVERAESITTQVRKPADNALELHPMLPLPQITLFFGFCWEPGACGAPWCTYTIPPVTTEMISNMIEGEALMLAVFGWALYSDLFDEKAPNGLKNILEELISNCIAPVIGWIAWTATPTVCCGCFWFSFGAGSYRIPVPWIESITPDTAEIKVQASRFSPSQDLGLWNFAYGNLTSGARASMYGGEVKVHPGRYKARVDEVWDGARNL